MFYLRSLFLTLLIISGCRGVVVQKQVLSGRELSAKEKDSIISELLKKNNEVNNIRALSHTTIQYNNTNDRFRQIFVIQKPDSARIDFLPFNAAFAFGILVINGEQALFLDSNNRIARKTDSIRKATKSTMRIPATYHDLLGFITARVPEKFLNVNKKSRILHDDLSKKYHLIVGDYDYFATINAETYIVDKFELRDEFNGKPLLSGEYQTFNQSNIFLPLSLKAKLLQDDAEIQMEFTTIRANSEIKSTIFSVDIPSDYEITNQW